MSKLKAREAEEIALAAFRAHGEIGRFMRERPGETMMGLVTQEDDRPFRVDLYWAGPPPTPERLKTVRSTEGDPLPRIAYCEIDKSTREWRLRFLGFEGGP